MRTLLVTSLLLLCSSSFALTTQEVVNNEINKIKQAYVDAQGVALSCVKLNKSERRFNLSGGVTYFRNTYKCSGSKSKKNALLPMIKGVEAINTELGTVIKGISFTLVIKIKETIKRDNVFTPSVSSIIRKSIFKPVKFDLSL